MRLSPLASKLLRAKAAPYLSLSQFQAHSRCSVNAGQTQHLLGASLDHTTHTDSSLLSTPTAHAQSYTVWCFWVGPCSASSGLAELACSRLKIMPYIPLVTPIVLWGETHKKYLEILCFLRKEEVVKNWSQTTAKQRDLENYMVPDFLRSHIAMVKHDGF